MEAAEQMQAKALKDAQREEKERAKAEKIAKKAEQAAKKEAMKREKELKREQLEAERERKRKEREEKRQQEEAKRKEKEEKRQQEEAKRKEKEAIEKKKQESMQKQKSIMERFVIATKSNKQEENSQMSSQEAKPPARSALIDEQLAQEFSSSLDELLSSHLANWRVSDHRRKPARWGFRRTSKVDVVKELRLASSDPCSSQSSRRASMEESLEEPLSSQEAEECKRNSNGRKLLMKLLQFDKTHRPAYYGTYSKRSQVVRPRRPLQKDPSLDYEIDSDEEWEEEEPGESLSECDEEEEVEKMDTEEETEDEFVVPDGYLSENEGIEVDAPDQETTTAALPSVEDNMEEVQRALNTITERSLKANRPYIISNFSQATGSTSRTREVCLQAFKVRVLAENLFIEPFKNEEGICDKEAPRSAKRQRRSGSGLADSLVPDIVEFLQNSPQGMKKTVEALSQRFPGVPKSQMETKIREISVYADNHWKVKTEVLNIYSKTKALADTVDPEQPVTELRRKRCLPLEASFDAAAAVVVDENTAVVE